MLAVMNEDMKTKATQIGCDATPYVPAVQKIFIMLLQMSTLTFNYYTEKRATSYAAPKVGRINRHHFIWYQGLTQ